MRWNDVVTKQLDIHGKAIYTTLPCKIFTKIIMKIFAKKLRPRKLLDRVKHKSIDSPDTQISSPNSETTNYSSTYISNVNKIVSNLKLGLKHSTDELNIWIRRGHTCPFMKEIQCARSLETDGGISYVDLILKMVCMFIKTRFCFFISSWAARLGAGAIWSMTHKEGKEREI